MAYRFTFNLFLAIYDAVFFFSIEGQFFLFVLETLVLYFRIMYEFAYHIKFVTLQPVKG